MTKEHSVSLNKCWKINDEFVEQNKVLTTSLSTRHMNMNVYENEWYHHRGGGCLLRRGT